MRHYNHHTPCAPISDSDSAQQRCHQSSPSTEQAPTAATSSARARHWRHVAAAAWVMVSDIAIAIAIAVVVVVAAAMWRHSDSDW